MISTRRLGSRLKRYNLPAVRRTITTDSNDSPFANETQSFVFDQFVAKTCTVQPLKDFVLKTQLEGISHDQAFTLFTNTPMRTAIEGTLRLGDSIFLPDFLWNYNGYVLEGLDSGSWFRVVKPKNNFNGVISHCECFLVRDTELYTEDLIEKYPLDNINSLLLDIDNINDLRNNTNGWETTWEV